MYFPRLNIGLNKVLQQSIKSTSYFIDNIEQLPETTYVSIRFEDLCTHPKATLDKIFRFLQTTPVTPIEYDSLIQKRPTRLMPTVAKNQQRIAQKLAPYFELQNYSG